MIIFKYLIIRIIVLFVVLQIFWSGASYLVPDDFLNAKFGFIAEMMVFLRLSLVFVVLFLIFSIYEINKFQKINQVKLRNTAIIFCFFLLLMSLSLGYYNIKY